MILLMEKNHQTLYNLYCSFANDVNSKIETVGNLYIERYNFEKAIRGKKCKLHKLLEKIIYNSKIK